VGGDVDTGATGGLVVVNKILDSLLVSLCAASFTEGDKFESRAFVSLIEFGELNESRNPMISSLLGSCNSFGSLTSFGVSFVFIGIFFKWW